MKNTLLTILFILVTGQLSRFGLPWWIIAPLGAAAGWLFPQGAWRCLLSGFAAGFLLWAGYACWLDAANAGVLSGRIGQLFMGLSRWNVVLLTGLPGGLVAGFACLSGRWARDLAPVPAKAR